MDMDKKAFDMGNVDIAWCPGCGNFGILNVLKQALSELGIPPERLVVVSGIGQAAKTPHYLRTNFFNGLHGRSLPAATGIKASNPELTVIAESGEGDMYGEGGNHFIHAIRRNPNITNIVHDNMIYGLTKGQASPTSGKGMKTPVQVDGVVLDPFNPIAVAIAQGASFVARASISDMKGSVDIFKRAILHEGYSLVDVFQPCVTFNRLNTYQWFRDNTYSLGEDHDPHDRVTAFRKAVERDGLPVGVFYEDEGSEPFEKRIGAYAENVEPLYRRGPDLGSLEDLLESTRMG